VGKRHTRYALVLNHEKEKKVYLSDGKAWYVSMCSED